jgi:DNA-binding transcriptional ArsR family regulator
MVARLAERELTVGELAEPLEISLPAASKHIVVLERAGLVRRTVLGRRHVCPLDPSRWPARTPGCGTTSGTGASNSRHLSTVI